MRQRLFVYGSLMPHLTSVFGAAERARLARESELVGPAQVSAKLYDLGDFPGLIESTPPASVQGVLLTLQDARATFAWLDPFEDIEDGSADGARLYDRKALPCMCLGQTLESWVYVLRRVPPGATSLASGKWHAPSP